MEKGDIIGKGREAEVIYWGNNRVLKLFYKDYSDEIIEYRYKIDTLIGKIFPNCPQAFEKIEERGRIGIVYEYIEGPLLIELMGRKIKSVGKGIKMLAEIHAEMHKHEIKDTTYKKNKFEWAINQTKLLDDIQKKEIINYMEKLPDGNTLCHGDLHPENIMVSKNKLYVIDWSNSYSGNPNGDVARTFYTIKYGLAPSDEKTPNFFFRKIKSLVANTYIKHYIKLTGISLKEIKKWDLVIYATRLHDPIPLEREKLLKMIHKKLKHLN